MQRHPAYTNDLGMEDKTYNGWTNYETWNVALWLSNDEGTYNLTREMAIELREKAQEALEHGVVTPDQQACYLLSEWLKDYVEDVSPDLGASMFADLLNTALSRVDWAEIAENILSE